MITLKLFILVTVTFVPAILYYKTSLAISKVTERVGRKDTFCPIPRKIFLFLLLVLILAIQYIDFIASDQATALARQYYGSDIFLHSTYSALSTDKTSVLLSFFISSLFLSNRFADRVLLDLSKNHLMSIILLLLPFALALMSFKFVLLSETVFVIVLASCLYNYEDNYSSSKQEAKGSAAVYHT